MKRWLLPLTPILSLALLDCGGTIDDVTCGPAYFNVDARTVGNFGASADARKVQAFLQATVDLNFSINDLSTNLITVCRNIGNAIGVPTTAYVPMTAGEAQVTTTCRPVYTEIQSIIRAAVPTNARLTLTAQPPVCNVDLSFAARCNAQCTASATAEVPQCSGQVVAQCAGSCAGSCTGTCAGTCATMSGTQCAGNCAGTCTGECRGACSVASSLRCEGQWNVMTNAQCSGACDAQARARATCTPGMVNVSVAAMGGDAAARARLQTLITALQANLATFEALKQRGEVIIGQAQTFLTTVEPALQSAGTVSATAALCSVRAVALSAEAAAKATASVQVTAQFSASLTVSGGANP